MIVVVGAGPAGIAATLQLRAYGLPVTVIDDNPAPGGQIWRGDAARGRLLDEAGAVVISGASVVTVDAAAHLLLFEDSHSARWLGYSKLVLATGSRELLLPFPGWTLPGVFGAGGLQALVKSGLPVKGKRVVVAGSGPLLLAVAALLRAKGAEVRLIAEQAASASLVPFAAALLRNPRKLMQGAGLGWQLAGVPYLTNCHVAAAEGTGSVQRVVLRRGAETFVEECDYAAVGYGLVPNHELQTLAGASADVIVAATGDVQLATLEGRAAGSQAAGRAFDERGLHAARRFHAALSRAFALRPELRTLPSADTLVCRCEDVSYGRLVVWDSFRAAKLQTRCGMGPCQGRVCGAAAQFLFAWQDTSVRPPAFPARISTLVTKEGNDATNDMGRCDPGNHDAV